MPQIAKARREPLKKGEVPIIAEGDLCYLITAQIIIPMWSANPGWTTASKIRQLLVRNPDLQKIKSVCRGSPFSDDEILNQAAMAYEEFYRRCVSNYEDIKARMNTDVYGGIPYGRSNQLIKGE